MLQTEGRKYNTVKYLGREFNHAGMNIASVNESLKLGTH